MELKTDKICRILNTPYDELSPQDFSEAQDQLEALRWREHAVTVENLETALAGTKAERDQFKGICERLKRELEEAKSDILGAQMATRREYDGVRDDLYKARVLITDLERMAKTDAEAIANLTKERDHLDDELTELRQAPSGTAKQAERIRELDDKLTASIDPAYHAKLAADLEQAKAQAANSDTMARSLAAECDAAQQRELKALRQLGMAIERADRAEQRERAGNARRERAVKADQRAFAKLAAEETAAAHEAMDKRDADLHKYGYGRAPGTPPAKVVGLASVGATPEVAAVMRSQIEETMATSIDGGQSWWCPKCQASLVPDVPHVCPVVTCRRCGSSLVDGEYHEVGACPGDGTP